MTNEAMQDPTYTTHVRGGERAHLLSPMNEDAVLDSEFASCIVS